MPIDRWLDSLDDTDHRRVDGDLAALADLPYPFLTDPQSAHQIERLSGHLFRLPEAARRQAIAYSLYVRQLDAIQEDALRGYCAEDCPRPPVGCCNADHFTVLSTADILLYQPSAAAMQLSHVIDGLQRQERRHALAHGCVLTRAHCACLCESGCSLRLFKSPRCVHYLCQGAEASLTRLLGAQSASFLDAMRETARQTISTTRDFTCQAVLDEAALLFPDLL